MYLSDWLPKRLASITPDEIEKRHARIADDISAQKPNERAGQARSNAVMKVFRAVYAHAAERCEDLPPSPIRRLKRSWFKVPPRQRVIKFSDLPAFYAALGDLQNPIMADYIRFLLATGLRRREAAAMKWSWIDFGARTFAIPAEKTKAGRALILPMSDLVHDLLVARRAIGTSGEYVFFANTKSGHIEEMKHAFAFIERATGIKSSPHDLRRLFATIADACEISTLAIAALMNHSPPKSVTSSYVIMSAERLRKPVELIAAKIAELCCIERPAGETIAMLKR
jgi:integrase